MARYQKSSYSPLVSRNNAGAVPLQIRVVLLGAAEVGKSAMITRLLTNQFNAKYRPTLEDLHSSRFALNGTDFLIELLDSGGNNEFPAMRRLNINNGHAFMIVHAVNSTETTEFLRECLREIREHRPNDFTCLPVVIVSNKIDCDQRLVNKQFVSDLLEDCEAEGRLNMVHVETSAKTGEGVMEAFSQLAKLSGHVQSASLCSALNTPKKPPSLVRRLSFQFDYARRGVMRKRSANLGYYRPDSNSVTINEDRMCSFHGATPATMRKQSRDTAAVRECYIM